MYMWLWRQRPCILSKTSLRRYVSVGAGIVQLDSQDKLHCDTIGSHDSDSQLERPGSFSESAGLARSK